MIKIYSTIKPDFDLTKGLFGNANSFFDIYEGHVFKSSYPGRFKYCEPEVDNNLHLVSEGVSDFKLYNYSKNKVVNESLTKRQLFDYSNQRYFYDESALPKRTKIYDRNEDRNLIFEGDLGFVELEIDGKLVLRQRNVLNCVDVESGRVLWRSERGRKEKLFEKLIDGKLLVTETDVKRYKTLLRFLNPRNGNLLESAEVNVLSYISVYKEGEILLVGTERNEDLQRNIILKYDIDARKSLVSEIKSSIPPSFLTYFDRENVLIYCLSESVEVVDKEKEVGSAIIGCVNIATELVYEIRLPNVCFYSAPGFKIFGNKVYAIGCSRHRWPLRHKYLISIDLDDFFRADSFIKQEPLLAVTTKLTGENLNFYRVLVDADCENFFQLHRHLSIGLAQAGSLYGFSYNLPDKSFDREFRHIICDVSNQSININEKLAIVHLCESVERELTENGFASGYDPEVSIIIEPKFT